MNRSGVARAWHGAAPSSVLPVRVAPPRRLLIVKLSSLGDIVQALPVASALRRQYPALRIAWAVEERFAPLLRDHPAIDRVVAFPRMAWTAPGMGWLAAVWRALRGVREEHYDLVLDLQGLFKSSAIAVVSRAPLRLGIAPQREGSALVSRAVPIRAGRLHAVDHYLEAAAFLGAGKVPVEFGLRVQPEAAESAARLLLARGVDPSAALIAINPSTSRRWDVWPAARWAAVADGLADAGAVVLVGGGEHARRHGEVAERTRRRVVDLTGATTLAELVALLDRCVLHVAPNTGTLHLAAALGRPAVGVYGPTAPWRFAPYGQSDLAVHHGATCGPTCPRLCLRRRRCLRAVTAEEVITRARLALERSPRAPREKSCFRAMHE